MTPIVTSPRSTTKGAKDKVPYSEGKYRRKDNAKAPDKARHIRKLFLNFDTQISISVSMVGKSFLLRARKFIECKSNITRGVMTNLLMVLNILLSPSISWSSNVDVGAEVIAAMIYK